MKNPSALSLILSGLATAIIGFLLYWFQLPPLNLRSPAFWFFIAELLIAVLVCFSIGSIIAALKGFGVQTNAAGQVIFKNTPSFKPKKRFFKTWRGILTIAVAAVFVLLAGGSLIGAEIFHADAYRDLIVIEDGDFAEDIAELSMDQIPVVDRDTASRLGQRQLGTIPDLVSQFEISQDYTQINVGEKPMRVTPLIYADIFKWLGNQANGIPGYITVDMVTQDTELVRLPEGQGIRYSESELFMRNIARHLRFSYPTEIFSEVLFEIDDNGAPYWVAPCMTYRIGLWSGIDVKGAVLVNAITGESQYYDVADIPQWVDRVYESYNVINQLNWNGKYQEGFLNAYFGQRNVRVATDGYNYIANNDDVYLYTGMTSATADESNIGFVLVNMRTKETRFYEVPGAEEYSAMSSAEGQVQHLGYNATFPLLLNVADRPTYFMSLKDASGLVKMYAYVDVERYHIVGTGDSVKNAQADYIAKLTSSDDVEIEQTTTEMFVTIADISSAVVEGSTKYYLRLENDTHIFIADISVSPELPFLKAGDKITLSIVTPTEDQLTVDVTAVSTLLPVIG